MQHSIKQIYVNNKKKKKRHVHSASCFYFKSTFQIDNLM